jgi:hypothetical protein
MSTFSIIAKLGGRDALAEALVGCGTPTTRDQVRMWETRGRIPGDAQVAIMRLAERAGIQFSASDFEPQAEPERVA